MFDTVGALERPDAWTSLEPRDKLTLVFLAHGVVVSGLNLAGIYDNYEWIGVGLAALIGLSSAAWGAADLATGRIPDDTRPGFAHERSIMLYTSSYLAGVMWLSLRFSALYPPSLALLDPPLCLALIVSLLYGFAQPIYTCFTHWDDLTETEQLRMQGMVVSGSIGAVFLLEATALLLNGPGWWPRVLSAYPAQSVLEPSVTLFAAYAVEAGMLIHRAARRGVITFATAVPIYAKYVLPLLTGLPMLANFWYLKDDVSFWDFLFLSD